MIERYKQSQAKIRVQDESIKKFLKTEGKGKGEKKLPEAAKKKLGECAASWRTEEGRSARAADGPHAERG